MKGASGNRGIEEALPEKIQTCNTKFVTTFWGQNYSIRN